MKLRALAPGKVNLGLVLGPVRADGRHELVTAVESVSLADVLTLSTQGGEDDLTLFNELVLAQLLLGMEASKYADVLSNAVTVEQ